MDQLLSSLATACLLMMTLKIFSSIKLELKCVRHGNMSCVSRLACSGRYAGGVNHQTDMSGTTMPFQRCLGLTFTYSTFGWTKCCPWFCAAHSCFSASSSTSIHCMATSQSFAVRHPPTLSAFNAWSQSCRSAVPEREVISRLWSAAHHL